MKFMDNVMNDQYININFCWTSMLIELNYFCVSITMEVVKFMKS